MHRNPRAVIRAAVSLTRPAAAAAAARTAAALQTLPKATPSPALGAWRPHPAVGPLGSGSGSRRRRAFSSSAADYGKDVGEVNRKFAEAREEIEAAMESKETVYFNEEAAIARDAANEALDAFDALLARLPPADADALRRSMGLKMEQLKAELKQLED